MLVQTDCCWGTTIRKIRPENVGVDFIKALGVVEDALFAVLKNVHEDGPRKLITETTLLNAVVLWEGFVFNLFVAYLNQDISRYQRQVLSPWREKLNPIFMITARRHPKVESIRYVLDTEGRNLTFKSPDEMVEKAKLWLLQKHAVHFKKITPRHKAVILAAYAIRNYLAHRSSLSDANLQEALESADLPAHLRRSSNRVHDVGKWLLAFPTGGERLRIRSFLNRFRALAKTLSS